MCVADCRGIAEEDASETDGKVFWGVEMATFVFKGRSNSKGGGMVHGVDFFSNVTGSHENWITTT